MSARQLLTHVWKMEIHKFDKPSEPLLPAQPFVDELGPVGLARELLYWGAMEKTTIALLRMPAPLFEMLPLSYRTATDKLVVEGIPVERCDGDSIIITFTPYDPRSWQPQSPLQTTPGFAGA